MFGLCMEKQAALTVLVSWEVMEESFVGWEEGGTVQAQSRGLHFHTQAKL